jgi:hypothetical protein
MKDKILPLFLILLTLSVYVYFTVWIYIIVIFPIKKPFLNNGHWLNNYFLPLFNAYTIPIGLITIAISGFSMLLLIY